MTKYKDLAPSGSGGGGTIPSGLFGSISPPHILGSVNHNFDPGDFYHIRLDPQINNRIITGLAPAGGNTSGALVRSIVLHNEQGVGGKDVTLSHQDSLSVAANRFKLSGAADITIGPGQSLELYYYSPGSRWRDI